MARLRELSLEGPSPEETLEVGKEVIKSSDRSAVILTSSNLEWQLGRLILLKLPNASPQKPGPLLERGGPLSGFYAKNQLGFALGLYNNSIKHDLEIISGIRNTFAHAPKPISFSQKDVAEACKKLKLPHTPEFKDQPEYKRLRENKGGYSPLDLRWLFIYVCTDLTMTFLKHSHRLMKNEKRRLKTKIDKIERLQKKLNDGYGLES